MPFKDVEAKRAYFRDWASRNKEWWETRRARNRVMVREAKNRPCLDCNQTYPYYVMEFDHLDGDEKTLNLSKIASRHWSEARIRAELAKCEVVCRNCHAERTARRGGYSEI